MSNVTSIRLSLFRLGLVAVVTSVMVLAGTFVRHVQATDYFKQAEKGQPWIDWGLGTALLGFVLCFFGRRFERAIAVVIALTLFCYWMLAAESLY